MKNQNLQFRNAFSVMDQYNSRTAQADIGEPDPLESISISVNYDIQTVTKQERLKSQLASLKLKRRTKF